MLESMSTFMLSTVPGFVYDPQLHSEKNNPLLSIGVSSFLMHGYTDALILDEGILFRSVSASKHQNLQISIDSFLNLLFSELLEFKTLSSSR